jgi:catabolite repression protein CreC
MSSNSVFGCCKNVHYKAKPVSAHGNLQISARQRGSVSSHMPLHRHRTESQSTNRLRSNSNQTPDEDESDVVNHPVEPRARTAQLPPVMV